MQNFHPVFIHFPIALLASSLLFNLFGQIFKNETILTVAKWNLWLGTLCAYAAAGSGWWAGESVSHSGPSHEIMELHKKLGWTIVSVSTVLSLWKWKAIPEWQEKVRPFELLWHIMLISVLVYSSHLYGRLVYEFGLGTNILSTEEKTNPGKEDSAHSRHQRSHEHKHDH